MKKIYSLILCIIIISTSSLGLACAKKDNNLNKTDVSEQNQDTKEVIPEPQESVENHEDSNQQIETVNEIKLPKEVEGFVLLKDMDNDFVIDLRYATEDNFTKKKIYPNDICVLRKETASKLVKANEQFKKLGYRIKIWDAYRPVYVQKIFWNIVKDSRFVANPANGGSIHNKGCAVDITLVDESSNELVMPSSFDDFSEKAYRKNSNMAEEAKKNMNLLTEVMVQSGFKPIDTEWWHFDDVNSANYDITDIDLNLFIN